MQKITENKQEKTIRVIENTYRDSLFLMRLSNEISEKKGVEQAIILMATTNNKNLLSEIGFSDEKINKAHLEAQK